MSEQLKRNISLGSETIIYTELTMRSSDVYLIYPTVCITRVIAGSGQWQIGSELCSISTGSIVFLNNLEPRRVVSDSGNLRISTFSFSTSLLSSAGLQECLRVFYGRGSKFTHTVNSPELLRIFDSIQSEMLSDRASGSLIYAYAIELLISAGRVYNSIHPEMLVNNFRCNATIAGAIATSAAYINENITSVLRIDELARRAGMSTGHYTRMFKKYIFLTPADYIAHCRIRRFLTVFSEGRMNTLDAAFDCGFTSSSGFYKTYRRICKNTTL